MKVPNEPRRPSLATIVGSSLAIAAAGSLIAFSSLAEQAGLQGLSARGIQPTHPERSSGGSKAITVPAPATAAPPGDPRETLTELVRATIERDAVAEAPEPRAPISFTPRRARPEPRPQRPDRIENAARVALAGPSTGGGDVESAPSDGPPYGHAYGHHKKGEVKPKPSKKKHAPKVRTKDQPVYARSANGEPAKAPKPPKMNKVEKVSKAKGKAKGHAKHAHGKGKGKSKGKGHSKHGH